MTRLPARARTQARPLLYVLVPGLLWAAISVACTLETPPYAEYGYATETARSVQATALSETARGAATAVAPAVQATSTAAAQAADESAPEALRVLAERYGLHFVRVPAGEFTMGVDNAELDKKSSKVALDEFWIGLTEVTNAQLRTFVEAGGYEDDALWTDEGRQWRAEQYLKAPKCWQDPALSGDDQPVTCITWYEATAYAAWLSRETGLDVRLPTVEEWEKAARGPDGLRYPWGEEAPDTGRVNYAAALAAPAPVGSYPNGASPYGALDMLGNAAEWTGTYVDWAEGYAVRGGSWYGYADELMTSGGLPYAADHWQDTIGLRLVAVLD